MQPPWLPERRLVQHDAAYVEELLRRWSAPGWPDGDTARQYRAAMQQGNTAYCTTEYHRWAVRSLIRPDGVRFAHRMSAPITLPVLQIHGDQDSCTLPATARGSGDYVTGSYRWHELEGVGHFPHEEAPEAFSATVLSWLDDVEPAL